MDMPEKSYWTAMDKEAFGQYLPMKDLGISSRMWDKQLPALQGRIRLGTKNVELGFMGKGKGSVQGNITPGMHGKTEREEMRQLAKLNEVTLSTHGSPNIMGVAGFTERGFNEDKRIKDTGEIKRAIDFAADVARGGPVVLHTGEFPRPIYGVEGEKFRTYEGEEEHHTHYIVNERTGDIIKSVREDEAYWEPEIDIDPKTKKKLYWEGRKFYNPITKKEEPIPKYAIDKKGRLKLNKITYKDFKEKAKADGVPDSQIPIEFLKNMASTDVEHEVGQAEDYEKNYMALKEKRDLIYKAYKHWKEREKKFSPAQLAAEKEKFAKKELESFREKGVVGISEKDFKGKTPSEMFKDRLLEIDKGLAHHSGVAKASRKRAEILAKDFENMQSMEEHAIQKSAKSIADLALYAYDKENKMKLKKPLSIAPEAVFPEQYGSHPDELKTLVQEARKQMVERLKQKKGLSENQAQEIAEKRIHCTFDVGHINTWRKYFTGTDEEFDKWLVSKAQELMDKKILGHVHISDNFGYEDEHLSAGEGNAPIRKFIKAIKKKGYKGPMIVEGGAQGKDREWEALLTTMRHFNSPVYKIDGETIGWDEIMHSYFEHPTGGPQFVMGAYAPDVDIPTEHRSWTLWSGVPFE